MKHKSIIILIYIFLLIFSPLSLQAKTNPEIEAMREEIIADSIEIAGYKRVLKMNSEIERKNKIIAEKNKIISAQNQTVTNDSESNDSSVDSHNTKAIENNAGLDDRNKAKEIEINKIIAQKEANIKWLKSKIKRILEEENKICSDLSTQMKSINRSLGPIYRELTSSRKELRKTHNRIIRTHNQYLKFRADGNVEGAKSAALKVDQYWQEGAQIQKKSLMLVDEGIVTNERLCQVFKEMGQEKCVKDKYKGMPCSSITKINIWTQLYSKPDLATLKYQQSWRQPEDYIFEEPTQKLENVKGTIVSISGRAFIERGIKTYPVTIGSQVLIGDKVNVQEGSQVSLELNGSGLIKITEKTSFQIPETEPGDQRTKSQKFFDDWVGGMTQDIKSLLNGKGLYNPNHRKDGTQDDGISTPTAVFGVRG